ncbi:calpastatin-like isoform X2 [Arapaima gigas]
MPNKKRKNRRRNKKQQTGRDSPSARALRAEPRDGTLRATLLCSPPVGCDRPARRPAMAYAKYWMVLNAQKNTATSTEGPGKADVLTKDRHTPLRALADTLPAPKPLVEPSKIYSAPVVKESTVHASIAVRVGEREDSLPPKYRTPKETVAQPLAPEEMKPSMDTTEALDILSGGFKSPESCPPHQTSGTAPQAPNKQPLKDPAEALNILSGDLSLNPPHHQASDVPAANHKQSSVDAALEDLEKDLLAQDVMPVLKCGVDVPMQANQQFSAGSADVLYAYSETLMGSSFDPEPAPVLSEGCVETVIVAKHVPKLGERDDTLPPSYRFPKTSVDGEQNHEKDVTLRKGATVENMAASDRPLRLGNVNL